MEQRFQWVCANGCGICDVRRSMFEYYREEDLNGNLIESKSVPMLVSKCCGADLMMWDNQSDEQINVSLSPLM